jgi:hypothetical protein
LLKLRAQELPKGLSMRSFVHMLVALIAVAGFACGSDSGADSSSDTTTTSSSKKKDAGTVEASTVDDAGSSTGTGGSSSTGSAGSTSTGSGGSTTGGAGGSTTTTSGSGGSTSTGTGGGTTQQAGPCGTLQFKNQSNPNLDSCIQANCCAEDKACDDEKSSGDACMSTVSCIGQCAGGTDQDAAAACQTNCDNKYNSQAWAALAPCINSHCSN